MSRARSTTSTASRAAADVDALADAIGALSLVSSLGKQYRVSTSRSASTASRGTGIDDSASADSGLDSDDDEYYTPMASCPSSATPPASARRTFSATPPLDESISCAPRRRARASGSRPGAQTAPPIGSKGISVLCSGTTKNGNPCGKKTAHGEYCHLHRPKDTPSAAMGVERKANVFLKKCELGWLQTETWNQVVDLLKKPPAPTDIKGYIYLAIITGGVPQNEVHIKVGRTTDIERRKKEWRTKCRSQPLDVYYFRSTRCYMRLEKIVLLILQDLVDHQAYRQPGFPKAPPPTRRRDNWGSSVVKPVAELCDHCKVIHVEVFRFSTLLAGGKELDQDDICDFISMLCESIQRLVGRDYAGSDDSE